MTQNGKKAEADPRLVYADIIDLPHWQSPTRPHMSLHDRSAQFASYKALSGFEDMIAEEARETGAEVQLESDDLDVLNRKLNLLSDRIARGEHPRATFTVFVPDQTKPGGRYADVSDEVKRIDPTGRKIILMTRRESGASETLDFDRIIDIRSAFTDDI